MNGKISVTIAGGAGYTGGELCRLLLNHPFVEKMTVQSASNCGNFLYDVHQDLFGDTNMKFTENINPEADVLFLCMGHGKSKVFLDENPVAESTKIIDLGNDFRLAEDSFSCGRNFVYGLTDSFASEIAQADNIANPGCFATAIQTALMPLANASLLGGDVHVTATTGSTGAGQSLSPTSHFSWRAGNMSTYKNFSHQHLGEIVQSVKRMQPSFGGSVNFIPYRGDFTRGIIATVHLLCDRKEDEIKDMYDKYYGASPFVHRTDGDIHLKQAVNTNKCILKVEKHGDYLMVTTVLDNLLKGASGQAVENMNLMFGFDRTAGLKLKPSAY